MTRGQGTRRADHDRRPRCVLPSGDTPTASGGRYARGVGRTGASRERGSSREGSTAEPSQDHRHGLTGGRRKDYRWSVERPTTCREVHDATHRVDGLTINYDVQGEGEPLVLIPYTSADHACWAFQLPAYTEQSPASRSTSPARARATSPPGPTRRRLTPTRSRPCSARSGSSRPTWRACRSAPRSSMHLAARHPGRVRSLSLHGAWHVSDDYLKIVVEQWRTLPGSLPAVADVVIQGIFPWCFTPDMYAERPEFVATLVDFVRSRPAQPVDAFLAQTDAVLAHDASGALGSIDVPTLITFGARDVVCSTRFAEPLNKGNRRQRAGGLRPPVARRDYTRTPKPSTARRSTSCSASARDTPPARRPARPVAREDGARLRTRAALRFGDERTR